MITTEATFPLKKGKMPLIFNDFIAMKFVPQPLHINGISKINITLAKYLIKSQQNHFCKNSGLAYTKFLLVKYHIIT